MPTGAGSPAAAHWSLKALDRDDCAVRCVGMSCREALDVPIVPVLQQGADGAMLYRSRGKDQ